MNRTLTKEEVAARLQGKSDAISRRIDVLEGEVASTGEDVKRFLASPLVRVGATLALGLAVGLLAGRHRRSPGSGALKEAYLDLLAGEAAQAVRKGIEPEEAVRETLRRRAPIIADCPAAPEKGFFRQTAGFAMRLLLGIMVRNGAATLLERLTGADTAGTDAAGEEIT